MHVKSIRAFSLFLVFTFLGSMFPSGNVTQRVNALSLGFAISGRVTDGNSNGIEGVTIMALQINYQIMLPIVMGDSTTSTPTIPPINSSGTEQNYYTVLTDSSGNYGLSGLPAGRYQLSAFKEGEDFNPISYTVLSSDAGGPYDFQTTIIPTVYSPQTKVLSQDALSKLISVSEDEITYTFSPQTSELAQVTVGDIILGGTSALTPEGFLRRVTSIQTLDGHLTFTSEQAALEEAFESLSVHGTQELDPSLIPVTSSLPSIQLISLPPIKGFGDFNREFNNAVLYDHDGNLSTTGDQIVANGIFSLIKPVIEARVRINNGKLEELYYSSTTTLQTAFTVSSKIKVSVPLTETHLLPKPFPLGVYQIGPLTLYPTLDMVASISGSVSGGFTSKITNTSTTTSGFWLLNDNIQYPKKTENNFSTDDNKWDWGFTEKVSFKGSIGPKVSISIYKAISGYVTPSVGFRLEIAPTDNPYLKLFGMFDAAVGFSIKVPIVKKDWLKWDVIAFEKSWLLYSLSRFTDNTQPDSAQNPSPQIGAVGQSLSATLSWSGSDPNGDMLAYDIYLDPENSYPTTKIANHQFATSVSPVTLTANTTYYWKVVTFDEHGASTASPVWYFTTLGNNQPNPAQNPSPQAGAVGQSLSATLSWTGSDPDGDMLVYDVFLDPENTYPTTKIANHQSATSLSPGSFTANTTYYWKVVTFDEHGASTASPVWYFKTVDGVITPSEMVYVPAGEFQMGCEPNHNGGFDCLSFELPLHTVYLDAFYVDKTEVTNGQYELCVSAGACNAPYSSRSNNRTSYYGNTEFDNYPVIYVKWFDAKDYCAWSGKRLLTEAEWEKAGRGANLRSYPWGDGDPSCSLANSYNNSIGNSCVNDTTAVGSYPLGASPYGALDMAGNVSEWVSDWWDAGYYGSQSTWNNPPGPSDGNTKVLRGGHWGSSWDTLLSADRIITWPELSIDNIGFRCASSTLP